MTNLVPNWTDAQIERVFNKFEGEVRETAIEFYRYIGENFVNKARESGEYTDRTGNLRSSIGFIVVENDKVVEENFETVAGGPEGRQIAQQFAQHLKGQIEGIGLIGVAGMEYAAAVEARGYDVITGSTPSVQKLMQETLEEMDKV